MPNPDNNTDEPECPQCHQRHRVISCLPCGVQGQEVFNNYGSSKPSEELLLAYGFVIDDNPHDTYLISLAAGTAHQVRR